MCIERILRGVAGTFVVSSVTLGMTASPLWFWFTAFVGLNLLQSAFTQWCPLVTMLRRAGVPECVPAGKRGA